MEEADGNNGGRVAGEPRKGIVGDRAKEGIVTVVRRASSAKDKD